MLQKIIMVKIIEKDLSPINPHYNDALQRSGGVYAAFARHFNQGSNKSDFITRKSEERPLYPSYNEKINFVKIRDNLWLLLNI